ncbi:MAG: hypothetical protein PHV20_10615 [Bacteroidales bacterium]|nr:hypothetical protein [Bacteroidales bacterium]
MRKPFFVILIIVLGGYTNVFAQNGLSFYEEHIDFTIDKNYFTTNGIYSFKNSSTKMVRQQIIFPFYDNNAKVDSIVVYDLNKQCNLPFQKLKNAIVFYIVVLPKDSLDVNISYIQNTLKRNSYIISSTKSWGAPLKKAYYSLTAPLKMNIGDFTFTPDSMIVKAKKRIYYWKKNNFLPASEFEFSVKR